MVLVRGVVAAKWRHRRHAHRRQIAVVNNIPGRIVMKTYLEMTLLKLLNVNNEKGAEVVEWVLWVGGIAVLAGVIYGVVNTALSTKTNTIMNTITPVAS